MLQTTYIDFSELFQTMYDDFSESKDVLLHDIFELYGKTDTQKENLVTEQKKTESEIDPNKLGSNLFFSGNGEGVDKFYSLEIDLPGFEKNEINVLHNEQLLEITAEKIKKADGLKERKKVSYTILKPTDISDEITANYKNGVLKLLGFAKQKELEKTNKINVL